MPYAFYGAPESLSFDISKPSESSEQSASEFPKDELLAKGMFVTAERNADKIRAEYEDLLTEHHAAIKQCESIDATVRLLAETDDSLFNTSPATATPFSQAIVAYSDDYPETNDRFKYLLDNAYVSTLTHLETLVQSDSDCDVALQALEHYVETKYSPDSWYVGRATEIVSTMINLGGVRALPYIKRVVSHMTFESNDSDIEYLKSDLPDHWRLHRRLIQDVVHASQESETTKEGIEFLSDLLELNPAGNISEYARAFERLGSTASVPHLLQNLKSENNLKRRASAEVLYHLELGRIGVTDKGVEYLGKLYDLGTYNDPDFFVRRLNNSGLLAVLSSDKGIEGVFPMDLHNDTDTIGAEVRKLTSGELFLPRADETSEERNRREAYLKLFIENYEDIFNDKFLDSTGVRLNSLALHEQGWFLLHYMELSHNEDTSGLERLQDFIRVYGEFGLKSYLALEYGGSGEEILDFAENPDISYDEKEHIFRDFYVIANEARVWRGVFSQVDQGLGLEFAPQVHEAFIRKNAEFFKAAQIIAKGEGGDVSMSELLKSMKTIAHAMRVLKGLYTDSDTLKLVEPPKSQDESRADGTVLKRASTSYILDDVGTGSRVVVSIRPRPTVQVGKVAGGEARINFTVSNVTTGDRARIGFDLSDYGEYVGDSTKRPVVSLDMGIGKPDRKADIWPSQRVGRVLELVEGSEGGHNELSFNPEVAKQFPMVSEEFRRYMDSRYS